MRAPLAPMPPGTRLLGHLRQRREDPFGLYLGAQRALGDVVRYRMGYVRVHQLTHPDHVQRVFTAPGAYGKGDSWARVAPLTGQGLVTAEGELWRRQRRIAQPSFAHDRLAPLVTTMTTATAAVVDRWSGAPGEVVPLLAQMRDLAVRIVLRSLLGAEIDAEAPTIGRDFADALGVTDRRLTSLLPLPVLLRLPSRDNRLFDRRVAAIDAVVERIVAEHEHTAGRSDLLAALVAATRDELGAVDRRQLRDEVATLMLAGFETTANALTWAFVLLDSAPEVLERLRAEVDTVLAGRVPTAADLEQLTYTRAVVEEVLRLRPPLWAIPRVALRDDEVNGYRIPAGDLVVVVPYVTHRHLDHWPDPERFDPDRFAPERRRDVSRWAYLPFGGGKRVCLGQHFAILEAQVVLAMVVARLDLHGVGPPPQPDPYATLRPTGEVPVRVTLRAR